MKKIFKALVVLLLFLFLATPASAIIPAVVALASYATTFYTTAELTSLGASIVLNAGVAYTIYQDLFAGTGAPNSGTAAVTPDATIGRQATITYIDTKDIDTSTNLPKVKSAAVTVKASGSDVMAKAKSNPIKYPKLAAATSITAVPSLTTAVGTVVKTPSYGNQLVSASAHLTNRGDVCTTGVDYSGNASALSFTVWLPTGNACSATHIYGCGSYGCTNVDGGMQYISSSTTTAPTVFDATPAQFAQKLANSPTALTGAQNIFSDYFGDIDQYIKDFPGNVSVVDTGDPLNVATAPTATLPTPATQSGVDAVVAGAQAKQAATSAATAAQGAVGTAQANYNANPTPENAQKLADAQASLANLQAQQAQKAATDAKTTDDSVNVSGSGFKGGTAYGTKTDSDLDLGNRFKGFFDQMKTTAVFSLPNQFLTSIPNSTNSVISFNGGRFGLQSFDFSTFSSVWITLKTIVLVIFGWYSIRIAVLKGGGG